MNLWVSMVWDGIRFLEEMKKRNFFGQFPPLLQWNILTLLYSFEMFCRIILIIAILQSPVTGQEEPAANEPATEFIWFSWGPTQQTNNLLQLPASGLASYYSHQRYPYRSDSGQQIFINLYKGYSQLWESQLITCRTLPQGNYCLEVDSDFQAITGPQTPQRSIGSITFNTPSRKELQLSSGENIKLLLKDTNSQRVEFFIMVFILGCIIMSLFSVKGLKYLSEEFSLQLTFSLCVLIRQCSGYVREAIENWLADSWKFWLFVPLSILAYQVLQNFTERCILKRPQVILLLSMTFLNAVFYRFGPNILYFLLSYGLILRLQPDPCLCEDLSESQRKTINQKSINIMRLLFTAIHLKLLFSIQSCYLLALNASYFGIGLSGMILMYICDAYRRDRDRRVKEKEQRRFKIKVFAKRAQLVKQVPSLTLSGILNEQCPICYEKIQNQWALTPCLHLFHPVCLHRWLEKSSTCPIDRKKTISDMQSSCVKLHEEPIYF